MSHNETRTNKESQETPFSLIIIGILFLLGGLGLLIQLRVFPFNFFIGSFFLIIAYGLFNRRKYAYVSCLIILFFNLVLSIPLLISQPMILLLIFGTNLLCFSFLVQNGDSFKPVSRLDKLVFGVYLVFPITFIVGFIIFQSLIPSLVTTTKIDFCKYVTNNQDRFRCYDLLAVASQNPEYCVNQIFDIPTKTCIGKVAGVNPKVADVYRCRRAFSDNDECLANAAQVYNDTSICDLIGNVSIKDLCLNVRN